MESRLKDRAGVRAHTVAILAENSAYGELLAAALGREGDLDCVARATGVDELFACAVDDLDVVIVDCDASRYIVSEAIESCAVRWPQAKVVVLACSQSIAFESVMSRTAAYLTRDASVREILGAARAAGQGMVLVSPMALREMRDRLHAAEEPYAPARNPRLGVTKREAEAIGLAARGLDTKSMARQMGLSVHTVRGHIKSAMTKLGAHNRLEMIVRATEAGMLGGADPLSAKR
ncbi:MAG: response regulator transcription factor [Acidimicrobiia bacterium]